MGDTCISEKSLLLQCGDLISDQGTVWSFGADRVVQTERSVEGNVVVRDVNFWGRTVPNPVIPIVTGFDECVLIS